MKEITIDGVKYEIFDQNITSDEIAFGAFSGYMAFNGELPKRILDTMAENYEKAINAKVLSGEITEEVGKKMIKEYGGAVMGLIGRKINNIFQITDGVITGVFDKNMNPDKSLDEILVPRILEYYLPTAFATIGAKVGVFLGGPVGGVIGGVAGAVLGAIASSINSDEWYKVAKAIVVDQFNKTFGFKDDDLQVSGLIVKNINGTDMVFRCNSYKYSAEMMLDHKRTIGSDLNSYDCSNTAIDFSFSFDKSAHRATINTINEETKQQAVNEIFSMDEIDTLTLDNHTYNIKNLSNLQIRNALDSIPEVSFLLSNINLPTKEIDLGAKGIYQVESGDTLSQIAQDNNMTTKDLVKLNTWLIDEGRVKFLQDKILVDTTLSESELNETNHTLRGDSNAENILIDANGGDNVFIGGSQKDKMQSKGKGYDKYFANNLDEITDNDGKGEVHFGGTKLSGGYYDSDIGAYTDGTYKYELNSNTLTITHKDSKESITINNFTNDINNPTLGIILLQEITIKDIQISDKKESSEKQTLTVTLSRDLLENETLNLALGIKSVVGSNQHKLKQLTRDNNSNSNQVKFELVWFDDKIVGNDETFKINASGSVSYNDSLWQSDTNTQNINLSGTIKPSKYVEFTIKDDDDDDDYPPQPDIPDNANSQDFASPLVLDLNNNGITSIRLNSNLSENANSNNAQTSANSNNPNSKIYFDLNNDTFKTNTAWIEKDDGFLVYDKNNNAIIDNGNELFGNNTLLSNGNLAQNGFEALSEFDSNNDGIINNQDENFHKLKFKCYNRYKRTKKSR